MDLVWGKAVASTDRWVGALYGAWIATEGRRLTHLLVRHGFWRPSRVAVPAERFDHSDSDGLYLRLSTLEVLGLPRVGDAGPSRVALDSGTRLSLADGERLRLAGLRVSSDSRSVTQLLVRRPGLARGVLLLPVDTVAELDGSQTTTRLDSHDLMRLPVHRADPDVERDLWQALNESSELAVVDVKGIEVVVTEGMAVLEGSVRSRGAVAEAAGIAGAAEGVAHVDCRLVND